MATQSTKKSSSRQSFRSETTTTRSPSPARITRLQEKDELTGLNDRLAAYIDHIRSLETENQKLHFQIQSFEETSQREVSNVKDLYERELAAARKLVDELSKENAQLQVNLGTYKADAEEWMRKYTQKDRELSAIQKKLADVEAKLSEYDGKLAQALRDSNSFKDQFHQAKSDSVDLQRQLSSARKQLEEETLLKVDLENRIQSLKEELEFKMRLHQSELTETRSRMDFTMDETDNRIQKNVEHRLQEALADLRREHELQSQVLREELESIYEAKISGLEKSIASQDGMDESIRIEISTYKSRISELQGQIAKLTNQNGTLEARVASLEADLAAERDMAKAMLESKEKEIKGLRTQMQEQMREYQDLLDIKVSLDLEIAAYRKLLEGEEERLNLSKSFSQSATKSTPRKRRRGEERTAVVEMQSEGSSYASSGSVLGSVEISDVGEDGKCIEIRNVTAEELSVAGWKLIHKVGNEVTEYKFQRATKLSGNGIATVWSSDSGAAHDTSTNNFVMKGQKWQIGDLMTTSLVDKAGKAQANYELKKSQRTVRKAARRQDGQQAEEKSCIVM